ncbi:MAG: ABC transporter permease [Spirochaetota bacterium]
MIEKLSKEKIGNSLVVNLLIPLGAIILALLIGSIFLRLAGADPIKAYISMFGESLGTHYGLTETLVKAVPLLLVGLGICVAFRSGMINIGAEGQMIAGALFGTLIALLFSGLPKFLLLPLVLIAGFLGGSIYGMLPGILKACLNVNEILSTVMLNSIALQIQYLLLRGVMIDPQEIAYGTGYPQSAKISEAAWLARIAPGTRVHTGIFIAVILAVIIYLLLWRMVIGYRLRAVGKSVEASRYAGIDVKSNMILSMFIAGGLAGLAGMVEVSGIHHRLLDGISAGYGFSGIVSALFGKLHPLGNIFAAFLFGALLSGAERLQRSVGVPSAMVYVIEGLVVIFVISSDLFSRKLLTKRMDLPVDKKARSA